MPPKLDNKSETERLQIVAPASWVKRVHEWRRRQEDNPNLSAAIRTLVDAGLAAQSKKRKS